MSHKFLNLIFSRYYDNKSFIGKTGEAKIELIPSKALEILSAVSDESYIILGLDPHNSRPDWMITQVNSTKNFKILGITCSSYMYKTFS